MANKDQEELNVDPIEDVDLSEDEMEGVAGGRISARERRQRRKEAWERQDDRDEDKVDELEALYN